jgi:hypothetical protein
MSVARSAEWPRFDGSMAPRQIVILSEAKVLNGSGGAVLRGENNPLRRCCSRSPRNHFLFRIVKRNPLARLDRRNGHT